MLHVARVRHLLSVLAAGPGFLWHCVQAADDLLELAWSAALQVLMTADSPARPKLEGCQPSLLCLSVHHDALRRALRCYRKHCVSRNSERKQQAIAKAESIVSCESGGGAVFRAPATPCGPYVCEYCPMRFVSKANKAAHQSTVHNVAAAVASASGSTCDVCGVEWWTTHRLGNTSDQQPL